MRVEQNKIAFAYFRLSREEAQKYKERGKNYEQSYFRQN